MYLYYKTHTGKPDAGKKESQGKKDSQGSKKHSNSGRATPQKRSMKQQEEGTGGSNSSGAPPAKKAKMESSGVITEDEVRRYLSRKPITSKELVKKFTSKKANIDKSHVPAILSKIIKKMTNVEEQRIGGKLYLSLKSPEQ